MTLTRRQTLGLVAGAVIAAPLVSACDGLSGPGGTIIDTVGRVTFDTPLAIPPLAQRERDVHGRYVFRLTAQASRHEFAAGRAAGTWGLNGSYLGPTLRARQHDEVVVHLRNGLPEPTTLHWHGMHLPPTADGGPHQLVAPGQEWTPTWRISQPAATLWYHPHPHGRTERHVYRGLAGLFIIDDDVESSLALPRTYGVDDIPVIVQDKRFDRDGNLLEGEHGIIGMLGDTIVVNGTIGPYQTVRTERIRLRLLNGSTGRIYSFGLAGNRPMDLVGTDGGLLPAPYRTDRVQLSPGERAEIVLSMSPGERVVLRSYPPQLGADRGITRLAGGEDTLDVLELRAGAELMPSPPVPARLADRPGLDPASAVATRTFRLAGRMINGRKLDMSRIDETVSRDTTEIWKVTNEHNQPHSFHIHDVQFQILTIGEMAPPAHLAGWKDTIYLPPHVTARLIMRFADYADPVHPYMYHCHFLLHEDLGMMGQFLVVEPGAASHHDNHGRPRDRHGITQPLPPVVP